MSEKEQLREATGAAIYNALANAHTIVVATVVQVNEKTINVQPAMARLVNGEKKELPIFTNVPPLFMHGGGSSETYPIGEGDDCILLVSERCFDLWYEGQYNELPAEQRFHDYSDCFALVGAKNKAGALVIPDKITQTGDKIVTGDYEHAGNYDLDGDFSATGNNESVTYSVNGSAGWSGTFATGDSRTVTVESGLITDVS